MCEAARQSQLATSEPSPEIRDWLQLPAAETEYDTVHRRMLECFDESDRARVALTLLLQATDSDAGYLYGVTPDRLVLLAALPEVSSDPGLSGWLTARLAASFDSLAAEGDETAVDETRSEEGGRYLDRDGRPLEPVFLLDRESEPARIAAVLALHVPRGSFTLPAEALLKQLAHELIEHGDVPGLALGERLASDDA